jgi:hypothetical protein
MFCQRNFALIFNWTPVSETTASVARIAPLRQAGLLSNLIGWLQLIRRHYVVDRGTFVQI